MGINYALLNNQYRVCNILMNYIFILENNIKQINNIIEMLNVKCDNLITKLITIDKQIYEIIDFETTNQIQENIDEINLHEAWDYYDCK
jgi:hypothetical protein